MNDNVVSFQKDGTRAMLEKVLKAYDEGRISSVICIGQGETEEGQRVLMPLIAEEVTMAELTFASTLLNGYAQSSVQYVLLNGVHQDA